MTRADRLFALVEELRQPGGRSVADLATRFRVSARTVFRDLAALEERGLPLTSGDGIYRLDAAGVGSGNLDSSELAIVRLALAARSEKRRGPLGRRIGRLVAKLDSLLGGPRDAAASEAVLLELDRLARARCTARIRYVSLGGHESSERELDPWKVFHRAGAWWVVGRCHLENEPRFFRLDRVSAAQPAGGRFRAPSHLDLDRLFAESWTALLGEAPAEA